MSRKKLYRFSKGITIFCIVMLVLLTAKNAVLEFLGLPPDSMLAVAEYAPFGIELGYNMMIKIVEEKKNGGNDNDRME